MGKKPLSPKQGNIIKFIQMFLEDNQYPPTVRDIQKGCDISSTSVVDYNLRILQRDGYLRRQSEVSRGIELLGDRSVETGRDVVQIPILGSIAAGEPLHIPSPDAWSTQEIDNVELPSFLTGGRPEVFGLKVKGDSMIDALIADGDLVLMEPANDTKNGDMVAALLTDRGEVTLKHFFLQNGVVTLQPANNLMEPIKVPAENVLVQGRVVGVIRTV